MRDAHSPNHMYPQHYPPIRRSARHSHQYLPPGSPVPMSHPQQYPQPSAMPANYSLDLSSYSSQHQMSQQTTSSSSPAPGSGIFNSFPGMSMPNVMHLSMDSNPMGIDLAILSAEEHHDLQMLDDPRASPENISERADRKRRARRAQSDDSIDTPPAAASGKKQRGRPRLDPKDENAADVSSLRPWRKAQF